MRPELREIQDGEYWIYGPSIDEIWQVIELVQKYPDYADTCVENMTSSANVPTRFKEAHEEVAADLRYYNYTEKGLLWSFGLWRMQGLFEALMLYRFLPPAGRGRLVGLSAKLAALKGAGYEIDHDQELELTAWAKLRNQLSHVPPEQHRGIALDREDLEEYFTLLKGILLKWEHHRESICKE